MGMTAQETGERVDETADRSGARCMLVERAIRADPVAEGNVEVEQQGAASVAGWDRIGKTGSAGGVPGRSSLGCF